MKIGLFGGSFNPVHSTHIDVSKAVMARLGLDRILLIPAGNPYHKGREDMLPCEIRYEMVRLAVENQPGLEVCDIDMGADGPTYTVDTLTEAAARFPHDELFFIMGQDSFETFSLWKDWRKIPELANIVAVSRAEADHGAMTRELARIFTVLERTGENIWKIRGGKSIYIIDDLDFAISSTLVREVWENGGDVAQYVPGAVADYISSHGPELERFWR